MNKNAENILLRHKNGFSAVPEAVNGTPAGHA